jgi:hypothetical protein
MRIAQANLNNETSPYRGSWRCRRGGDRRRDPCQRFETAGENGRAAAAANIDRRRAGGGQDFGAVVDEADLSWETWLKDHIPEGLVRKSASPSGVEDLKGSIVRSNFAAGAFRVSRRRLALGQARGGDQYRRARFKHGWRVYSAKRQSRRDPHFS